MQVTDAWRETSVGVIVCAIRIQHQSLSIQLQWMVELSLDTKYVALRVGQFLNFTSEPEIGGSKSSFSRSRFRTERPSDSVPEAKNCRTMHVNGLPPESRFGSYALPQTLAADVQAT